jgi:hypothetical protein
LDRVIAFADWKLGKIIRFDISDGSDDETEAFAMAMKRLHGLHG